MSRSTYTKIICRKEVPAGIHLLTIRNAKPIDEETIFISFIVDGHIHEQTFKIGTKKLVKMLSQIDLDADSQIQKKDMVGKKVWGYIREVWRVNDFQKQGEADYVLFDTSVCINENNKPVHSDDPDRNDGVVQGDFVEYIEI